MAEALNERLVVRNFGPVSNLDIEIRPLTLFIGTQGSGKSTVSKLLAICRNAQWWLQIIENADSEEVTRPFTDYAIAEYFEEDSYFCYHADGHQVKYEDGKFSFYSTVWRIDMLSKIALLSDDRYRKVNLYVPAERNLIGSLSNSLATIMTARVPLPTPLLEYMSLFERATKESPKYEVPFFGVNYVKKDNRNMIELRGKEKTLPLSASSSGLQSAIPMLMVIDYALKSANIDSFVIEEPEQNLFPENQREVLNFIASRLDGGDNRKFIITTHSPYMLSCLNVLMLAYKLYGYEEYREQVENIVRPDYMVTPDSVAAYSLTPTSEDGVYCKSLISVKTGMVSMNELDSASIYIGEDFDRLYHLYVKAIKGKK